MTVGTVVGLLAAGHSRQEILELYPYREEDDIVQAPTYVAWRADEMQAPSARVKVVVNMNLSPAWIRVLQQAGFEENQFH